MFRVMLILCVSAVMAVAGGVALGQTLAEAESAAALRWQCEPMLAAGGQWVLRCEDLQAQADFDPALSDAPGLKPWYVPTWSMPIDPRMTVQLIRAALCRGAPCGVSLKMDNRQPLGQLWTGPLSLR